MCVSTLVVVPTDGGSKEIDDHRRWAAGTSPDRMASKGQALAAYSFKGMSGWSVLDCGMIYDVLEGWSKTDACSLLLKSKSKLKSRNEN